MPLAKAGSWRMLSALSGPALQDKIVRLAGSRSRSTSNARPRSGLYPEGNGEPRMSFEQEGDEAGFAASKIPLWLLHGAWTESRESGVKEPSAFQVQGGEDKV